MAEAAPNTIASATELVVRYGHQVVLDRASVDDPGRRADRIGRAQWLRQIDVSANRSRRDAAGRGRVRIGGATWSRVHAANVRARRNGDRAREHSGWRATDSGFDRANMRRAPPESARSGMLLEQIEHFDGWNLEHRIKSLITNLHAPEPERVVATSVRRRETARRALPRFARPAGFSDSRRADESSRHRLDRVARGFSRALQRHLSLRDARSLFSRSHRDAGRRACRAGNFTATTATTPTTCWPAQSVRRSRKCRSTSARNS